MNEDYIGWALLAAWTIAMLIMTNKTALDDYTAKHKAMFKKRLITWWLLVALGVTFVLGLAYRMRQQPLVKIPPAVDTNALPKK